ncbi:MAG: dihydroneopterin aldolase [Chlamydiia bacterium]|nr:dihydroneopterin aldolase [Chlamydiia bacterium]
MTRLRLGFEDLQVYCIIGVWEHERQTPQQLLIDCAVTTSNADAARSDRLQDTLCYAELAKLITACAMEGRFQLLETLADAACCAVRQRWSIEHIWIKIRKPAALPEAAACWVEMEQSCQVAS